MNYDEISPSFLSYLACIISFGIVYQMTYLHEDSPTFCMVSTQKQAAHYYLGRSTPNWIVSPSHGAHNWFGGELKVTCN